MIKIRELEKKLSPDFTLKIGELDIEDGERVALIGANGSGKSTLLRLLSGVLAPDRGEIHISVPREKIGYEPQNAYAFRGTVEKNIKLGVRRGADPAAVMAACGLEDLKTKRSSKLSGGEKQRMCFARTMAGNYSLLLLDEPFSAVDIETSVMLERFLCSECEKNGTTLLMAAHSPSQVLSVATKVLIMNAGEVSEYSDVLRLKEPESEFGKKFVALWRLD